MARVPAVGRLLLVVALGLVIAACSASGNGAGGASPSVSIRPGPAFSPRPTIGPTEAPVTGEVPTAVMDAVRADLTAQTGTDASAATVVKAEAVEWPDGSLGCPELGVMYIQVITPGYQVVLELDGSAYDYRVAGEGDVIRLCEGLRPASGG